MIDVGVSMSAGAFSEGVHISEEIVFNVRRVCDELIGMVYLRDSHSKNNVYPSKLEIDSIGRYLSKREEDSVSTLENHLIFLQKLNGISNAHKHSFLNTDYNLHEKEEPFVFALGLKGNNLNNQQDFYAIPVRILIEEFNLFYKDAVSELKNWT